MADEKMIKFRGNYMFTLPESIYNEFMKNRNKTEFITNLITNYYDKNTINVRIDERIKDLYENDIYKDMRVTMLLIDFYTNSNNSDALRIMSNKSDNMQIKDENTSDVPLRKNRDYEESAVSIDENYEDSLSNNDDDEFYENKDEEENENLKVPENTVGSISSMFKKRKIPKNTI